MILLRLCYFGKLLLTPSFYLILCSWTKSELVAGNLAQKYVSFENIGIKMCQVKCAEQGGCESFQYDLQTLTCQLPSCEVTMFAEKSASTLLLKNPTHVLTGACGSKSCRLGSLCIRTRSGKAVCVKGGEQFTPETCPQKKLREFSDVKNQLFAACCKGDMCQVRDILAEGKYSTTGKYNRTPVMLAAYEGHGNVFDFLVSKGCDLSHVDTKGNTILHHACSGGDIATVRYILSRVIFDINSRDSYGRTPLMVAAYFGHNKVLELLVGKGGNVSLRDVNGDNILHKACRGGHVEMVEYVLSHTNLDINSRDRYGRTPMMVAACYRHKNVLELLVGSGGNVSLRDVNGDNMLHLACRGGHVEMVEYVLSHTNLDINSRGRRKTTPLMAATYEGYYNMFVLLVEKGSDVSLKDDSGHDIIHIACSRGHLKMVKYLRSQDNRDVSNEMVLLDSCG